MPRSEKWDERFLQLAEHISQWSKDPSTKVGAVLVDSKGVVIGMGYNGFPRGVFDKESRYADRKQKYSRVVHAELNAILNATTKIESDSVLYVTPLHPCTECTKAIIQSGISRIVVGSIESGHYNPKWAEDMLISQEMLQEAKVDRTTRPRKKSIPCLLGSSVQPSNFIGPDGAVYTLGDVVSIAQERSRLSVDGWNTLAREDEKYEEALIQMVVDELNLKDA